MRNSEFGMRKGKGLPLLSAFEGRLSPSSSLKLPTLPSGGNLPLKGDTRLPLTKLAIIVLLIFIKAPP